jgi:uncharacterized protein
MNTEDEALHVGSLDLPLASATKTFAILAKRGAGKSYTAAVLAEEFFKHRIPFVVFDPIDVWWGLRLESDGTTPALPIVVFGLEHADIPLERTMGRQIAQAVIQKNVSCILSTFGMPKVAQRQLITEFSEELLNSNDTPRHVFIEEAHEFVPQRVFGEIGKTFHAVSNLIVMGRNRGIGVTLINQRAATINKDVLTQVDTLLAFRNVAPQDRNALHEWVAYHAADGDFEAFIHSLPSLPTGEGWIWSPEFLERFERIRIRERETFHPDRERLGNRFVVPQLEHGDVQRFIEHFTHAAATTEVQRSHQVATRASSPQSVSIYAAIPDYAAQLAELKQEYEQRTQEKDAEIARLTQMVAAIRDIVGNTSNRHPALTKMSSTTKHVEQWIEKLGRTNGAGRILDFLVQKAGLKFTHSQVALATGMSANGGTFQGYLATLKRNHLIIQSDGLVAINPDLLSEG